MEVLRFLMEQHNLKQEDLGECAPQSRISDILSGNRSIIGNVVCHDGSGADQSIFADGDAGEDRGVRADAALALRGGTTAQSASDCGEPSALVARGYLSFVNITPWPIKTLSSIVTPSQRNEWHEILHRRPIDTLLYLNKSADPGLVADLAAIGVDEGIDLHIAAERHIVQPDEVFAKIFFCEGCRHSKLKLDRRSCRGLIFIDHRLRLLERSERHSDPA